MLKHLTSRFERQWFENLVVPNLVVFDFYAEALFCALLRPVAPFCDLFRSFADLRFRSFACFCV